MHKASKNNQFPKSSPHGVPLEQAQNLSECITWGRVLSLDPQSLTLFSGGVQGKWPVVANKTLPCQVGDIVEVNVEKSMVSEIKVLVPCSGENPFWESSFSVEKARRWQQLNAYFRSFFSQQDFIEITTPTLVESPGLEPHLDAFKTQFQMGSQEITTYLPTSPEFHLKKALSQGFEKIYEIKSVFRNGELSAHHQPEFTMVEWYRAYEDLDAILKDFNHLFVGLQNIFPNCFSKTPQIQVYTMAQVFKKVLGFTLTPATEEKDLQGLAGDLKMETKGYSLNDLFSGIFVSRIEPWLAQQEQPVVIKDFPPFQSALARIENGWADRMELYWRGFELANGFSELNDPTEQEKRFVEEQAIKKREGKQPSPIDEQFLKCLKWGMPPAAGMALGVDRLFMALFNEKEIRETRMFPFTCY